MTRVAVFGTGSWGTAFSMVLADAGTDVVMWGRRQQLTEAITRTHENPDNLPGIPLPETLTATHSHADALAGAEVVVFAVPSQTFRANLEGWAPALPPDAVLVSLMKGIELGTTKRMSQVIGEVTGAAPERIAVVSGPNLAREIAQRQPAATVVGCADEAVAEKLQQVCATAYFRPYTNTDVVGVELGGAVKNVIALAVGIAKGMGMGDNSQASIVTRGLAEITRLGLALGADAATFAGLAGVGDLVATCLSPLSRNRTFGEKLGQGRTVDEIVASTSQIAEGVKSAESILELARAHDVDMPIVEHVAAAVHDGLPPGEIVRRIMSRSTKAETE
jgi:glycerol-3-phosphate dehydrogenase (NAD(P)+)